MINYSCDKCKQPISSPHGVATITINTHANEPLKLQFCKDCTRSLLPETPYEEHPVYSWIQTLASWMDERTDEGHP